jgi:predicted methyltransferase
MLRVSFILSLIVCALAPTLSCGQNTRPEETERLAKLLNWQPEYVIADVGAGEGEMSMITASKYVGPVGKVYATELDPKRLARLEELATQHKNIIVIKAAETETNLPSECCDSIFMRLVYHHLTKPAELDASLFQSLKPGGLLGVIDEEPVTGSSVPKGVPKNRGGHGVPQQLVIDELTAAGFQVVTARNDWPSHDVIHQTYCMLFRKPSLRQPIR